MEGGEEEIGPALPPHLLKALSQQPQPPPPPSSHKRKELDEKEEPRKEEVKKRKYGPSLEDLLKPAPTPSYNNNDNNDNYEEEEVGPALPSENENILASIKQDNEEEEEWNRVMSKKMNEDLKIDKRENWMLTLPESNPLRGGFKEMAKSKKAFNKNESLQIDQSWTLLPSQQNEYQSKPKQPSNPLLNAAPVQIIKAAPSTKAPSLMEIHQQKIKEAAKEKKKKGEEVPKFWDRERDFVNYGKQLTSTKQKELVEKTKFLSSKFAPSSH